MYVPLVLFQDTGHMLKIFALGIPLDVALGIPYMLMYSALHSVQHMVLSQFRCFYPENQTIIFLWIKTNVSYTRTK